jgi:hypothetical protein
MMAAILFKTGERVRAPSVGTHEYDGIKDARKMLPRPGILQLVQHCQSTMCPGAYKETGGQAANLRAGSQ